MKREKDPRFLSLITSLQHSTFIADLFAAALAWRIAANKHELRHSGFISRLPFHDCRNCRPRTFTNFLYLFSGYITITNK
jgi:hypothetical protein